MQPDIQPEILNQLLHYEPDTGRLFWRERSADMFRDGEIASADICLRWNAKCAGKAALNCARPDGYLVGRIFDKLYRAHRVIWAMNYGVWPDTIDHINGNRSDNRIANLRSITKAENAKNIARPITNSSGYLGVGFHKARKRWRAYIRVDGKTKGLGYFDTPEEALEARKAASEALGYHPNHGRTAAGVPYLTSETAQMALLAVVRARAEPGVW